MFMEYKLMGGVILGKNDLTMESYFSNLIN